MVEYPPMDHLPGFWDDEKWDDDHWAEFVRRAHKKGNFKEMIDQWLHRCMGRWRSRSWWEARERKQWPSGTGSYDPCIDHFNWLIGARYYDEAWALRVAAWDRRPEWGWSLPPEQRFSSVGDGSPRRDPSTPT